jgi:hypothetical protein
MHYAHPWLQDSASPSVPLKHTTVPAALDTPTIATTPNNSPKKIDERQEVKLPNNYVTSSSAYVTSLPNNNTPLTATAAYWDSKEDSKKPSTPMNNNWRRDTYNENKMSYTDENGYVPEANTVTTPTTPTTPTKSTALIPASPVATPSVSLNNSTMSLTSATSSAPSSPMTPSAIISSNNNLMNNKLNREMRGPMSIWRITNQLDNDQLCEFITEIAREKGLEEYMLAKLTSDAKYAYRENNLSIGNLDTVARWNEKFQQSIEKIRRLTPNTRQEDRIKVYEELAHHSQDFVYTATTYGKIIISEVYLPPEEKTIKPLQAGVS